jgi:hypothetical protein
VSEFCSSIAAFEFHEFHKRHLESCNDQYSHYRNSDIYIYACCRTMCCCNNYGYYSYESDHSDLCGYRPLVSEFSCAFTTINFHEFHQRHLESGNDQYQCSRNNHLYIHTDSWSMCANYYNGYYSDTIGDSCICSDWATVPELSSSITAIEFYEFN